MKGSLQQALAVVFALLLLTPAAAMGASAKGSSHNTWQQSLSKKLQRDIRRSPIHESELGLYVTAQGKSGPQVIYQLNADRLMVPASLTKLATAAAVLNVFPVDHKFNTQLLVDAPVEAGELKGNLYLKGEGDPSFVSESMWNMVDKFWRSGIRTIDGNIVVDDSYFDDERIDDGRDPEPADRAFEAPVGAMSFNWNCVNIYVRPGQKVGQPAKIFADPQSNYIKVVNQAKTVSGHESHLLVSRVSRSLQSTTSEIYETVIVGGTIGVNSSEQVFYRSIERPAIWSGYQLKSFLARRGITVKGHVLRAGTPAKARLVTDWQSKTVAENLQDMLKFSNNFVAEMLTKDMAADKFNPPGKMDKGLALISQNLTRLGLKDGVDFHIVIPSGLSHDNKIKPKALHQVLLSLTKSFAVYPEFLTALPIAGDDGTLKKRMKDTPADGWVRAKTGTLDKVVGLAGYAGRKDGSVVTFVFMYNGRLDKMLDAEALFDKMAIAAVD